MTNTAFKALSVLILSSFFVTALAKDSKTASKPTNKTNATVSSSTKSMTSTAEQTVSETVKSVTNNISEPIASTTMNASTSVSSPVTASSKTPTTPSIQQNIHERIVPSTTSVSDNNINFDHKASTQPTTLTTLNQKLIGKWSCHYEFAEGVQVEGKLAYNLSVQAKSINEYFADGTSTGSGESKFVRTKDDKKDNGSFRYTANGTWTTENNILIETVSGEAKAGEGSLSETLASLQNAQFAKKEPLKAHISDMTDDRFVARIEDDPADNICVRKNHEAFSF